MEIVGWIIMFIGAISGNMLLVFLGLLLIIFDN